MNVLDVGRLLCRVAMLQLLSLLSEAVGGMGEPGVRGPLHSLPVYPMIRLPSA